MNSVQDLLGLTRNMDDVTVSMTIQDAVEDLFSTSRLARNAMLGDNVIDLIISNLGNAVGSDGIASLFTVTNLLAQPSARVGSVNPIEGATQYLNTLKTGENSETFPKQEDPNDQNEGSVPFEFLMIGDHRAVKIPYRTDEFTVTSTNIIFTLTDTIPAGMLCFVAGPEIEEGRFETPNEDSLQALAEKEGNARKPAEEEKVSVTILLHLALSQLRSGNVRSRIKSLSACNPIPNFLRSENWPKIIALIEKWLEENPE